MVFRGGTRFQGDSASASARAIRILFLVVLADMIGFGFIIPLLPYYARNFGATDVLIGLLTMVYPLGQVFASPLIGRLSDKFGRKRALLLSVGGTFASLLTLGFARSLPVIFLSRLLDGLTGGNITVAQSYVSDFTDEKSRARNLGLIGAAFGLGFIVGPAFGGFLSRFGFAAPAFAAAGISLANLLMILLLLPDSRPAESSQVPFTFAALRETLQERLVGALLLTKIFYSFAFTLFESTFALFAMRRLKLPLATTSYVLAYVGILVVISQGFLIRVLTKKYSEMNLLRLFLGVVLPFLALYSFSSTLSTLVLLITPLSLFSAVVGVSFSAFLTRIVSPDRVGGTLGLLNAVDSLMRIVTPLLGGLVISLGAQYLGMFTGTAALVSLLVFVLRFPGFADQKETSFLHGSKP